MPISPADAKWKLENLRHDFSLDETEDSWEKISKAIVSFGKIGEQDGAYESAPLEVVLALRAVQRPLISAMNSERTRLSGVALDLLKSVAEGLGSEFDQFMPTFMPPLLGLCGRTSKVVLNRAKAVIVSIIEATQLPSSLPYFVQSISDKSATMRLVAAESTLACLNSCNPPDLEKEARAKGIETVIRGTVRDSNPDVRKISRKIFESYKILLPSRVESFIAPLSPTTKKYLDIKPGSGAIKPSKSLSNLKALKLDPKPSTSNAVTTSAVVRPAAHARTASTTSVVPGASHSRNLATTMTRVTRKETAPPAAVHVPPTAPSRPVQTTRSTTEPQRAAGRSKEKETAAPVPVPPVTVPTRPAVSTMRSTTAPEIKRSAPPLRSAASSASLRAASAAVAPRRMQMPIEAAKAAPVPSSSTTTGPRRIMMPPPPPPAPKKEPLKRPASRADSAASTSRPDSRSGSRVPAPVAAKSGPSAVPPPAPKKAVAATTTAATSRVRPPPVKPPVPKFKPTSSTSSNANAAGSNNEPTKRPTAAASTTKVATKSAVPATSKAPAASSKTAKAAAVPVKAATSSRSGGFAPQKAAAAPAKTVTKKPSTLGGSVKPTIGLPKKRAVTPAQVELPPSPTPEDDKVVEVKVEEAKAIEEPKAAESKPTTPIPQVNISTASEDSEETIIEGNNSQTSVSPAETRLPTPTNDEEVLNKEIPPMRLPTSYVPRTPSNPFNLALLPDHSKLGATPISALLASIERGFEYVPSTPLSPMECYLPGPDGVVEYTHETHARTIEGDMPAFNELLHGPLSADMFKKPLPGVRPIDRDRERAAAAAAGQAEASTVDKRREFMLQYGEIGTVDVAEHEKLYPATSGLPVLDDLYARPAFQQLNK